MQKYSFIFWSFFPLFNQIFACMQMQAFADPCQREASLVLVDFRAKTQEVPHQLWCRGYIRMIWYICNVPFAGSQLKAQEGHGIPGRDAGWRKEHFQQQRLVKLLAVQRWHLLRLLQVCYPQWETLNNFKLGASLLLSFTNIQINVHLKPLLSHSAPFFVDLRCVNSQMSIKPLWTSCAMKPADGSGKLSHEYRVVG